MKNSCVITPQVLNKNGESVDSKLFTDLLAIIGNRNEVKRVYLNSQVSILENEVSADEAINNYKSLFNNKSKRSTTTETYGRAEFSNNFNGKNAKQVLENIIPELNNELHKQIAETLLTNVDKINFVKFGLSTLLETNVPGNYDSLNGKITLNSGVITNYSKDIFHETILHELTHAFTVSALDNPTTIAEKQFAKSIELSYKALKGSTLENTYGFTNQYEFITEILNNQDFINELKSKKPSVLTKIINAIKELLGIKTNIEDIQSNILNFINKSTPSLTEEDVRILNKRTESLQAQLNNYTSRIKKDENRTVSDKEVFFLSAHKKIVKTLHDLKNVIKVLNKNFNRLEFKHNQDIKKIIQDYIEYNQGVYDEGYKNSPLYKNAVDEFDTIKQNYDNEIEVWANQQKSLSSHLADLSSENILDYEAEYMNYALGELNRIDSSTYNLDSKIDQDRLAEDYNFTRMVINSHDIVGIVDRAKSINQKLMDSMNTYVSKLSDEYLNTGGLPSDSKIDVNTILNDEQDISTLSYLFEGFGDYARIETQLIHSITMNGKEKARLKSLETGKQIMEHMKALEKWGASNGLGRLALNKNLKKGSLRKIYGKLVEVSNTNRLDLVKPYTIQYYKDANEQLRIRYNSSSTKEEVTAAKIWLRDNYYNKPSNPNYINPKYSYIQDNKPLKDFYDFFKKTVADGYSILPEYVGKKNEEKIPSIMRDTVWEFLSLNKGNTWKSISLALKTLLLPKSRPIFYDETGNIGKNFTLKELNKDEVRLRMIGEIDPTMKSFDLGKILYEFTSFANDYSEMNNVLPNVRLIQNIAETKRYVESADWDPTGLTSRLGERGTDSRTYRAIDLYIKNKVLAGGDEGGSFGKIPLFGGKILNETGEVIGENNYFLSDGLRGFIKYTRLLTLGYNPFSAVNNVAAGIMADIIEAQGGKNFSKRQLLNAIFTYTGATLTKKSKIFDSNTNDTKTALLIDLIQPLQEIGEWSDQRKINMGAPTMVGNVRQNLQDGAFIMQEWGEHFVQTINMIAYLKSKKSSNGKSLWDSTEIKDGKLDISNELKAELEATRDNIRDINNSVHGNYSKDNSSVFENNLLFQSAMVFKKWIPYMVRNRFMKERYNYRTGNTDKGFYLSASDYVSKSLYNTYSTMHNKLQSDMDKLMTKKDISRNELVGIRKVIGEAVMLMLLATMKKWLTPPPDDDKDSPYVPNWWEHWDISMWDSKREFNNADGISSSILKSIMDTSNRLAGETTQFYSPQFYMNDVYARHALWTTASQLVSSMKAWGDYIFSDNEKNKKFIKGARKGELKVIKATSDVIPYIRQIDKARVSGNKTINELTYNK